MKDVQSKQIGVGMIVWLKIIGSAIEWFNKALRKRSMVLETSDGDNWLIALFVQKIKYEKKRKKSNTSGQNKQVEEKKKKKKKKEKRR